MKLIRDFKDIGKNDAFLAGGKGAALGEMTKAGILIPPGFVILTTAYEFFLEETHLNVEINSVLEAVDHENIHTIEKASEEIRSLILKAGMPKDISAGIKVFFKKLGSKQVAIRSSATAEDSAGAASGRTA